MTRKEMQTEKLPISKLDHVGVIVSDMDRAVEYYQSLGIGPFESRKKAPIAERKVYGKLANEVKNTSRIARLGPIYIELVQPISGASVQRASLDKNGEGISHLGFAVDDVEKEIPKFTRRGFKVISSVKQADGTGSVYFDTDRIGGVQLELTQKLPL